MPPMRKRRRRACRRQACPHRSGAVAVSESRARVSLGQFLRLLGCRSRRQAALRFGEVSLRVDPLDPAVRDQGIEIIGVENSPLKNRVDTP